MANSEFKVKQKDDKTFARIGELKTPHGVIETPVFMPVGTNSAVKTLVGSQILETQAQIILSNSSSIL